MKWQAFSLALLMAAGVMAQEKKLRVIAIGAHPDDCDIKFGGTAIKLAAAGHAVKFLSLTNGDAGHHEMAGGTLARRRYLETQEAARRFGIAEYQVLDNHDAELEPVLAVRKQVIRAIRDWKADVVVAPRPNDYHPDHRYTGVLVQDAAFLVVVPNVVADSPALRDNPVFLYYQDGFEKPATFRPDVVVAIDDVWEKKVNALDAHVSQFYEWLPWLDHRLDQVPREAEARKKWLGGMRVQPLSAAVREAAVRRYGADKAGSIRRTESFELCEYGRRPGPDELSRMFPR